MKLKIKIKIKINKQAGQDIQEKILPWEEGDGLEAKIVLRKPENHRSSAFWMKAIYGGLPQLNIKAESWK